MAAHRSGQQTRVLLTIRSTSLKPCYNDEGALKRENC